MSNETWTYSLVEMFDLVVDALRTDPSVGTLVCCQNVFRCSGVDGEIFYLVSLLGAPRRKDRARRAANSALANRGYENCIVMFNGKAL